MRKLVRKYPKLSLAVVTTVVVKVMTDRKIRYPDPYGYSTYATCDRGYPRWLRVSVAFRTQMYAQQTGAPPEEAAAALVAAWKGYPLAG